MYNSGYSNTIVKIQLKTNQKKKKKNAYILSVNVSRILWNYYDSGTRNDHFDFQFNFYLRWTGLFIINFMRVWIFISQIISDLAETMQTLCIVLFFLPQTFGVVLCCCKIKIITTKIMNPSIVMVYQSAPREPIGSSCHSLSLLFCLFLTWHFIAAWLVFLGKTHEIRLATIMSDTLCPGI